MAFDDEQRPPAKDTVEAHPEPNWGLGRVTAKCTAQRFPGCELLDTSIELSVAPFSITWKDRQKLVDEIAEVIGKYLI